ncbi:MAG: sporulation protein YqfD, partial [Ruminococcus sp.]|nr:sporulation protein YqfD [Ruminococcus sp.]
MMVGVIRFFRGYVDFSAEGKFPERFLNITSRNGVSLWNAQPVKNGLEGSMYISDYRKIRRTAKKSKVKTKITAKHGLPFFTAKYKNRIGLPIGTALGIILLLVLSNFIWSVKITGNESVSTTKIAEILYESGIRTGGYKNNLDVQKICRDTMLDIEEIGWMSVNLTGNIASVEIKEKAQKPELNTNTNPSNIKAKCDGVITDIKATKGTTKVLKGSGVAEGDLLVSGITETKLNTLQYVHAEAEVYADVYSQKELIKVGKDLLKNGARSFLDAKIDNDAMAIMLFTSGTTSQSKAVMLSHTNITTNIYDIGSMFDIRKGDTLLS